MCLNGTWNFTLQSENLAFLFLSTDCIPICCMHHRLGSLKGEVERCVLAFNICEVKRKEARLFRGRSPSAMQV